MYIMAELKDKNDNFFVVVVGLIKLILKKRRDEFEEDKDIFRKSNFYLEASTTDKFRFVVISL